MRTGGFTQAELELLYCTQSKGNCPDMAKLLDRKLDEILSVYDFIDKGEDPRKELTEATKHDIRTAAARLGTRLRGSLQRAPKSFVEESLGAFELSAHADAVARRIAAESALSANIAELEEAEDGGVVIGRDRQGDSYRTCGPDELEAASNDGWRVICVMQHQRLVMVNKRETVLTELKFVLRCPREPEDKLKG